MERIAIRVDASAAMGSGHLRRCLTLARALQARGGDVVLLCRALDPTAPALLADTGLSVLWLPAPGGELAPATDEPPHAAWAGVPWQQDAAETASLLRTRPPAWLLIDHYAFDARWHGMLRRALGCRLGVIDDLADRPLDCDLLLDQNWHADHRAKYAGRLAGRPQLLGGPRFALLGTAYQQAAPRAHASTAVRSVGIFLGGSDPLNHSPRVLRACREVAGFHGPIEIVSTSANPHLEQLRQACARWHDTHLTVDLPDLADFFARHDLHIGAGGGATWERCRMGAPTLALVCAANQAVVVPALAGLGALAQGTTPDDEPGLQALGAQIRELLAQPERRQTLAEHASRLVDGRGAERVALTLLRDAMSVRPATLADAPRLHAWRNDPATRAVSGNPNEIALADHMTWMRAVLEQPQRHLLVGEIGGQPVGSIRFDQISPEEAEVSLYLDPGLHGLGLGARLLTAGENWLRTYTGAAKLQLLARVMPGNATSSRLFEAAGYAGGPTRYTRPLFLTETPSHEDH